MPVGAISKANTRGWVTPGDLTTGACMPKCVARISVTKAPMIALFVACHNDTKAPIYGNSGERVFKSLGTNLFGKFECLYLNIGAVWRVTAVDQTLIEGASSAALMIPPPRAHPLHEYFWC